MVTGVKNKKDREALDKDSIRDQAIEQALRAVWWEKDQRDNRERIPEIDLINIVMDKDPVMKVRKQEKMEEQSTLVDHIIHFSCYLFWNIFD